MESRDASSVNLELTKPLHTADREVAEDSGKYYNDYPYPHHHRHHHQKGNHHHLVLKPTGTQVHVQALDEIVAVNSFFTVAVFIGLSFTNPTTDTSLVNKCPVGDNYKKYLLVLEVVAFSSYLMSSLIAQSLKLFIVLLNSKDHPEIMSAQINPMFLRVGMLVTAIGTVLGTIFLTFSIAILIQLRLGHLVCDSASWSKWAAIPMVTMVSTGLCAFISGAIYAFVT